MKKFMIPALLLTSAEHYAIGGRLVIKVFHIKYCIYLLT
jgi:hypothetical protein